MVTIYRTIYGGNHYYMGIAYGNLAGALTEKKEYSRAEQLLKDALGVYARTLPADHPYVAIAHVKLSRTYLASRRWRDAEREASAGYDLLTKSTEPNAAWLESARKALVQAYDSLREPESAKRFRDELEAKPAKP
jgi:serine/threonine-protein kinase